MDGEPDERVAVAERAARAGGDRALEDFRGDLEVETKTGPTDVVTAADSAAQERVFEVLRESFPDEPIVGEEDDAAGVVPDSGAAWIVDPIDGTANFVRGQRFWTTAVAAVVDAEPVAAAVYAPALGDCYVADGDEARRDEETLSVSDEDRPEAAAICPTLTWTGPTTPAASEAHRRFSDALDDRNGQPSETEPTDPATIGNWRRFGSAQLELALVADGGHEAAIADVGADPWDTVAGVHLIRAAGGTVTTADGERWRHDADSLVASNGALHDVARGLLTGHASASGD